LAREAIPGAVLGSDAFDVEDIDPATLAFGPDGAAPRQRHSIQLEDVNGDGLLDLVSHHPAQQTGIAPGDTEACLTGELLDGTAFEGSRPYPGTSSSRSSPWRRQPTRRSQLRGEATAGGSGPGAEDRALQPSNQRPEEAGSIRAGPRRLRPRFAAWRRAKTRFAARARRAAIDFIPEARSAELAASTIACT
jgi:hypothetical protein